MSPSLVHVKTVMNLRLTDVLLNTARSNQSVQPSYFLFQLADAENVSKWDLMFMMGKLILIMTNSSRFSVMLG